jgi:uncharacterized protein YkwD
MLINIISFIVGILALIGVGAFSYQQLEQSMGSRPVVETPKPAIVVVQKETAPAPKTLPKPVKVAETPVKQETQKTVPAKTSVSTHIVTNGSLVPSTATTVQKVAEPGPLRVTTPAPATPPDSSAQLSIRGVIEYTNGARSQNGGLPALIENGMLDRDAQIKLDDMFAKQYFEHESPTGVGPSDIAKAVGYDFILVGENLALGDFGSDEELVLAWMNSPGHRANILNAHYQEIGVAVGKGVYEGRLTWLTVQSFGMPLSSCPAVDAQKKAQIDANNVQATAQSAVLEEKRTRINATPTSDPNYNTYVNEFNALVRSYNMLVADTRTLVAEYNATVQAFNNCIAAVTGTH